MAVRLISPLRAVICASACLLASIHAELPFSRLANVFPAGGRAGEIVKVHVNGNDLDDLEEIYFTQPGFSSKVESAEIDPKDFSINISSNVPPGVYDLRAVGRFGASNPRRFVVGTLPEVLEASDNGSPETPQRIAVGTTVNGHARANGVTHYLIPVHKNDRVLIQCSGRELDSRLQPSLILSSKGRDLARERKTGFIDYLAAEDGGLLLKLSDILYRGGDDYFYRLTISVGPHIEFVIPKSGVPGEKGKFTLYGQNLPGGEAATEYPDRSLQRLSLEIQSPADTETLKGSILRSPADAMVDGFEYRLRGTNGVSNPVFIEFARGPALMENTTNDTPELAQAVTLPVEFEGQFYPAADEDWIKFDATKGSVYWIEAMGDRLGLSVAPFILLQKMGKNGKREDVKDIYGTDPNLGGVDLSTTHRDPSWRFEVKDDGEYRLLIKDLFHPLESNPAYSYHLSLRKESPDFRLLAASLPPPLANKDKKEATLWAPALRPGETIPIRILAFRRDNLSEPIEVSLQDPPAGISSTPLTIPSGASQGTLFLTAATNAMPWTGALKIIGASKAGEAKLHHRARAASLVWQVEDYTREPALARLTDQLVISVSKQGIAPIVFATTNATVKGKASDKLSVPLRWARQDGFQGNLKIRFAVNAIEGKEFDFDGKTTNGILELVPSELKLAAGTHQVRIQGTTSGKYRRSNGTDPKTIDEMVKVANQNAEAASKEKTEADAAAKKSGDSLKEVQKNVAGLRGVAVEAEKKLARASEAAAGAGVDQEKLAAKTAAESAANDAKKKLAAAEEQLKKGEATQNDLQEKVRQADAKVASFKQRAKTLTEKNQQKDVTYTFYAPPLTVQVEASK